MRTRTAASAGQSCAYSARCMAADAATAVSALVKTAKNESPSVLISTPVAAARADRMMA